MGFKKHFAVAMLMACAFAQGEDAFNQDKEDNEEINALWEDYKEQSKQCTVGWHNKMNAWPEAWKDSAGKWAEKNLTPIVKLWHDGTQTTAETKEELIEYCKTYPAAT